MGTAGASLELRHDLGRRLADARARTDELFGLVQRDSLYDRPIAERHRIVFYIGHVEAFDWNMVARQTYGIEAFQPEFDHLFAFGIDPVDEGLPTDQPSDWPSLAEIERYQRQVRETVDGCLRNADLSDRSRPHALGGQVFQVAIEHRLMHAETLAYMIHQLPSHSKTARSDPPPPRGGGDRRRMVAIPAGRATLGLARADETTFGWDNEFDEHTVEVDAFSIDSHNVTNGQYLEFLRTGGYEDRGLWSESDWEWRLREGVQHPGFWHPGDDGEWLLRGMFSERPLPLDWPVYVSHAEATAYAHWARKSLPTEAQLQRATFGTPDGSERAYPWGAATPEVRHGNFNFERWDPVPVGSYPEGDSAFGVSDLIGNGWEWTATRFAPFEGFHPVPYYPGYSANFFDGRHYVIKGASPRTAACMVRRSFRNWFQPHYPHVYSTFRCVEN